jgi:hypothetical protein
MGWGVRVGIEDNIYFDRQRTTLARNIDLLKRIHTIAQANDRTLMTPHELRKILDLEAGNGTYGRKKSGTTSEAAQARHAMTIGRCLPDPKLAGPSEMLGP